MNLHDVEIIEGGDASEEEHYMALQSAINSLDAWKFQGHFGRSMMDAIEEGYCMFAESGTRDYWGNYIPSRFEVQINTKGSYGFVAERHGAEWADMIAGVTD